MKATEENVVGRYFRDIWPEDVRPKIDEYVSRVISGQTCSFQAPRMDGNEIGWWEVSLGPIHGKDGTVEKFITISNSITERKLAEEKLKLTQFTVDSAADPIFWVTSDARLVYVNEAACNSLGYSRGELLSMRVHDLDPALHAADWPEHWEELRKSKSKISESLLRTKDGRIYPVELTINHVEHDGIEYHCTFARDISERKLAEEGLYSALEESSRRRHEVTALLECSRAVLHYREFEPSARAIFDSCKALIGADAGYVSLMDTDGTENKVLFLDSGGLQCTVDPSLPMPLRGLREEAHKSGRVIYENNFSNSEWMKLMPEGHVELRNVLFVPLVIDGNAVGLMGIANKDGGFTGDDARIAAAFGELMAVALHDSRTLESLEESEERFRSVAQSASDAIISSDKNGNIVFWNRAAEKVFGYDAEEATGKPLTIIMPEAFRQAHEEALRDFSSTGHLKNAGGTVELLGLRKGGTKFPLELSLSRWKTKDDIYFTAIIRDITERKIAEKETIKSAQLASIGELAAGVAFEINNPLNGIINYAEILASKVRDENQREVANRLIMEGDRISRVVRSLLSFTRREDSKTQPMLVKDILSEVMDLVSSQLAMAGIEVNVDLPPDLPYIRVTPQLIEQVFLGIIANARDAIKGKQYLDSDSKCINIKGRKVNIGGTDFVEVSFMDNGAGMPEDVLAKAMVPFFSTKGRKGTGLGLSVSQSIVNDHGGRIDIESEEGKFTTVTIHLLAGRGIDAA